MTKEGRSKFNPRPDRVLTELGPRGWQSEILPTALTLRTHTGEDLRSTLKSSVCEVRAAGKISDYQPGSPESVNPLRG